MAWMTLPEAAVATRSSVRTVHRRIIAGQLRSRHEGRRTLVDIEPDSLTNGEPAHLGNGAPVPLAVNTHGEMHNDRNGSNGNGKAELDWAGLAVGTINDSVRRAQLSMRIAWSVTAAMAVLLAAGGWQYHRSALRQRDELADLNAAVARAEGQTRALADEVGHARQTAAGLVTQVADARSEAATFTAKFESTSAERTRLSAELTTLRSQVEEKQTALVTSLEQNKALTADRERLTAERTSLTGRIDRELTATTQLHEQLSGTQQERAALKSEAASLRETLDQERAGNVALRGLIETFASVQRETVTQVQDLQCRVEGQNAGHTAAAAQVNAAMTQLSEVSHERDRLRTQVGALQTALVAGRFFSAVRNVANTPMDPPHPEASPRPVEFIEPVKSPLPADNVEQGPPRKNLRITVSVPSTRPAEDQVVPPSAVPLNRTACATP